MEQTQWLSEYFARYQASLSRSDVYAGLIELKEWLMRACVRAIKHGAVALSREHLERTALSISQCEKILAESREGETRLNDHDGRPRLRTLLGIEPQARGGSADEHDKSAPFGGRKRGKPGQRAPRRDPTTREVAAYA